MADVHDIEDIEEEEAGPTGGAGGRHEAGAAADNAEGTAVVDDLHWASLNAEVPSFEAPPAASAAPGGRQAMKEDLKAVSRELLEANVVGRGESMAVEAAAGAEESAGEDEFSADEGGAGAGKRGGGGGGGGSSSSDSSDSDSSDDEGAGGEQLGKPKTGPAPEEEDSGAEDGEAPRTKNEIAGRPSLREALDLDLLSSEHGATDVDEIGVLTAVMQAEGSCVVQGRAGGVGDSGLPLREGSAVCAAAGARFVPVGAVAEIFGPVAAPFYVVSLAQEGELPADAEKRTRVADAVSGLAAGALVYSLRSKAAYVSAVEVAQASRQKGCDASNVYDEEVPEHLRDFSDDEAEAQARQRRRAKKGGRAPEDNAELLLRGRGASARGRRPGSGGRGRGRGRGHEPGPGPGGWQGYPGAAAQGGAPVAAPGGYYMAPPGMPYGAPPYQGMPGGGHPAYAPYGVHAQQVPHQGPYGAPPQPYGQPPMYAPPYPYAPQAAYGAPQGLGAHAGYARPGPAGAPAVQPQAPGPYVFRSQEAMYGHGAQSQGPGAQGGGAGKRS